MARQFRIMVFLLLFLLLTTSFGRSENRARINFAPVFLKSKITELIRDCNEKGGVLQIKTRKAFKQVEQDTIYWCNIDYLVSLKKTIDNASYDTIKDFLFTFDDSCSNNVEYSQFSNELLFEVLEKNLMYLSRLWTLSWKESTHVSFIRIWNLP